MPITIPQGVTVTIAGSTMQATGPKGTVSYTMPNGTQANVDGDKIQVVNTKEADENASVLQGLARASIANLVKGVQSGFEKKLELSGVGYRASIAGRDLMLSVGFSHQVKVPAPEGITFAISENTISVSGINKQLVGDIAAKVRSIRPPEPYKGKGIRYVGEVVRRKAGKAAKVVGGAK